MEGFLRYGLGGLFLEFYGSCKQSKAVALNKKQNYLL